MLSADSTTSSIAYADSPLFTSDWPLWRRLLFRFTVIYYFDYTLDFTKNTLAFKKLASDSLSLFIVHIDRPDTNQVLLRGLFRGDSLKVTLRRTNRHFQLAERQFHWLSEANR